MTSFEGIKPGMRLRAVYSADFDWYRTGDIHTVTAVTPTRVTFGARSSDCPERWELVEETPAPSQTQVGGNHYTKLKIQPMEYSMANGLDALQHTIVKYVTRFRDKAGLEDLRKARHCIDMLIEHEEAKTR